MFELPLFDIPERLDAKSHWIYDDYLETPPTADPDECEPFLLALSRPDFLRHLRKLCQDRSLWPDPYDYNAGLVVHGEGEAIAPHQMPLRHPDTKLYKGLTLYYVFDDCDSDMLIKDKDGSIERVALKKNRLILFANRNQVYLGFSEGKQPRRLLIKTFYHDSKTHYLSQEPRWARDAAGPVGSKTERRRVLLSRVLWFFSDRIALLAGRVDL